MSERQSDELDSLNHTIKLLRGALEVSLGLNYELLSIASEKDWPATVARLRNELFELEQHSESYRHESKEG